MNAELVMNPDGSMKMYGVDFSGKLTFVKENTVDRLVVGHCTGGKYFGGIGMRAYSGAKYIVWLYDSREERKDGVVVYRMKQNRQFGVLQFPTVRAKKED